MKRESTIFKFDDSVNELLEISFAFQKSRVLITAVELGIFDILGEEFKTSEQIASEAKVHQKSVERLLNVLVSMKLLVKRDGKFCNTDLAWNCLVKGNQHYIGSMNNFSEMWKKWSSLTETIRTGEPVNFVERKDRSPKQTEDFISSMHWNGSQRAQEVVKLIDIKKSVRVLDLGGASGAYAMEFVRNYPQLDVTVYDLPEIIDITRRYLEVKGFEGKINTLTGDVLTDKLPKNHYDLIFVSNVLHIYSFWENMDLVKNIYDSLRIGGRVVIHEMLLDDNRTSPEFTSMFSLHMLVNTKSGEVLTESEIWLMLKEAWFTKIERKDTDFGTSLMFGSK